MKNQSANKTPVERSVAIAGKRVPIESALFRLRFDKVALRFVADLQTALQDIVPDGETIVFTIAAPIRLASKSAAELEQKIRSRLKRLPTRIQMTEPINGNDIHVRLVNHGLSQTSKVIGLVYTPGPNPQTILDAAETLLR